LLLTGEGFQNRTKSNLIKPNQVILMIASVAEEASCAQVADSELHMFKSLIVSRLQEGEGKSLNAVETDTNTWKELPESG
jgi:hypothetical protein